MSNKTKEEEIKNIDILVGLSMCKNWVYWQPKKVGVGGTPDFPEHGVMRLVEGT